MYRTGIGHERGQVVLDLDQDLEFGIANLFLQDAQGRLQGATGIDLLRHQGHLSGLDLGQVENIVDDREQVVATLLDHGCVFHILFLEVAELLALDAFGKAEDGV